MELLNDGDVFGVIKFNHEHEWFCATDEVQTEWLQETPDGNKSPKLCQGALAGSPLLVAPC